MRESVPTVVVDAANVVGSRPDGWWRDRAGATCRLRDRLSPNVIRDQLGFGDEPEVVLVTEGRARSVSGSADVRVVAAAGSGDDAIVDLVAELRDRTPPSEVVVVTADRELIGRVRALGARAVGPRSLD